MNVVAPSNSSNAMPGLLLFIAAKVEKMSGPCADRHHRDFLEKSSGYKGYSSTHLLHVRLIHATVYDLQSAFRKVL